jgi:hypothetical protein
MERVWYNFCFRAKDFQQPLLPSGSSTSSTPVEEQGNQECIRASTNEVNEQWSRGKEKQYPPHLILFVSLAGLNAAEDLGEKKQSKEPTEGNPSFTPVSPPRTN